MEKSASQPKELQYNWNFSERKVPIYPDNSNSYIADSITDQGLSANHN